MNGRSGTTLPELILVAWLFTLILLAAAAFAGAQGRMTALTHDRVRAAEVIRTVDVILNAELRYSGGRDVTAGPDSVRLRAVRGSATICAGGPELGVRYTGVRQPDSSKDSALVITGVGTVGSVHSVVGAYPPAVADGCGDMRLRLDPAPSVHSGHVLVFETGAYHLAAGALRYRRGRGGRQPVTETVLSTSRLDTALGTVRVHLTLRPDEFPRRGIDTASLNAVVRRLNPGTEP